MNHFAFQQNSYTARDEMRSSASLFCPKPRRILDTTINNYSQALSWHVSHEMESWDSEGATDLFDLILTRGSDYMEQSCSPPILCGSPPTRVANPLNQDARFGDEKLSPFSLQSHIQTSSGRSSTASSSASNGGCVRVNFGSNPAVRVEGFDCLDRDNRNCSIFAHA